MAFGDRDYMHIGWATRCYERARRSTRPMSSPAPYLPISSKSESNAAEAAGPEQSDATGEKSHATNPSFDSILRKIQERGIDSLSQLEREWLITGTSKSAGN